MPSESVFYLTGIFLLFGLLVYIYLNFFESDKSDKINPDYLTGLKYLLDEESDKAINIFSDLIEIDDETIQTHLALGFIPGYAWSRTRSGEEDLEPRQVGFSVQCTN